MFAGLLLTRRVVLSLVGGCIVEIDRLLFPTHEVAVPEVVVPEVAVAEVAVPEVAVPCMCSSRRDLFVFHRKLRCFMLKATWFY